METQQCTSFKSSMNDTPTFGIGGHISVPDYKELDNIFDWAFTKKAGPIDLIACESVLRRWPMKKANVNLSCFLLVPVKQK
ncbi:hypothetical protein X801_00275 [Opisthorchis viverrini]|uniref:Uncharacterized protein n=1 Tax=Opisthorchis viverrini TaxID=6198 RepID=A0A1S8XAU8_OPIVI|nr:hypothetical protein X801_00275 [Opisthorchis viverrini]